MNSQIIARTQPTKINSIALLLSLASPIVFPQIAAAQLSVGATATVTPIARHDMTSQEYQNEANLRASQGYRVIDVSGYAVGGVDRYAAIWSRSASSTTFSRHNLSASEYQQSVSSFAQSGYYPTHVSTYAINGQPRFAVIWDTALGKQWVARHDLTSQQYQQETDTWTRQGYRTTLVSGYTINGQPRFAAVWIKDSVYVPFASRHNLSQQQYQAEDQYWRQQGYQLVSTSGYVNNNQDNYAAIWEKRAGSSRNFSIATSSPNYQSQYENRAYAGEQLRKVNVFNGANNQPRFVSVWQNSGLPVAGQDSIRSIVTRFREKYRVPGLSLAIAKDGKLVFAQGYGLSDQEKQIETSPKNLFRVASISKPITSIAIMKLMEEGKLSLTSPIFGSTGLLGNQYGTKGYSSYLRDVKVQNLLEHASGGWGNAERDPMFMDSSLSQSQLITWTLDNLPLNTAPGQSYQYSNFGYNLLGRVIESRTAMTYENYIKDRILKPIGITQMSIGGNSLNARKPGEVIYYGQGNENPYNMNVTRMDAHGGWIASPIDLVRLAVHVDGFTSPSDILSHSSIKNMTTPSNANSSYAKGWSINTYNHWWHTGSMPGSSSMIARLNNGFTLAIVMNTRTPNSSMLQDVDTMAWAVIGAVPQWPQYNLF
jgi:CubicO group peptidase (beta-lactamase class C family)